MITKTKLSGSVDQIDQTWWADLVPIGLERHLRSKKYGADYHYARPCTHEEAQETECKCFFISDTPRVAVWMGVTPASVLTPTVQDWWPQLWPAFTWVPGLPHMMDSPMVTSPGPQAVEANPKVNTVMISKTHRPFFLNLSVTFLVTHFTSNLQLQYQFLRPQAQLNASHAYSLSWKKP